MNKSIKKDTVFLTGIQLTMQCLSMVLNIFINRMLGTENLGLMSLINAFFVFAIIISNGNIFVASSRFIAEETGKKNGDPSRIFCYSMIFALILSSISGAVVFASSGPLSTELIKHPECKASVRMLAFSLTPAAVCSCIKGYFHAYRKVRQPAVSEMIEFIIKTAIMFYSAAFPVRTGEMSVFTAIALSIISGESLSLIFLLICLFRCIKPFTGNKTTGFGGYIRQIIPVTLNSYIPCILSTANDALVPYTLKRSGCSTSYALSCYGIFEGVVLPVLFFPSMVLSCLSVILVPEIARDRTAGNNLKNISMISDIIKKTVIFSVITTGALLLFGRPIGYLSGSGEEAGRMITILAPVVPFIYLEIILEAVIKGLGKHSFSSMNYLAEYIIRISVLLVTVPFAGFYGVALSYYASNIVCNFSRMLLISKVYNTKFRPGGFTLLPEKMTKL